MEDGVNAKPKRRWIQFHLSTAIVVTFIAGLVIFANSLPILHYAGEQDGQEAFEISGYGWPFQIYNTGLFYGPFHDPSLNWAAVGGNLLFLGIVVAYAAVLSEWRRIESRKIKRGVIYGTVTGSIFGLLAFGLFAFTANLPVISMVSLSIGFKPWWQNWRAAVATALVSGLLVAVVLFWKSEIEG